jgi:hypothetical protein
VRMTKLISITGLSLYCCCYALAQTDQHPDVDLKIAEQRYEKQNPDKRNLHVAGEFSDRAKGVTVSTTGTGVALKGPPFATKTDWATWFDSCASSTIVLAGNLDSKPILSDTKNLIYTVSHFAVLQPIKSDGPLEVNQTLVTYRLGGELKDAADMLRVETAAPAYKVGNTYLLLLNREKAASLPQYAALDETTVSVRDRRIYPSSGEWAGFLPGTAVADVIATLQRISKTKACGN